MTIFYQNAQYIQEKVELFSDSLSEEDPEVVCLVEHGLRNNDIQQLRLHQNYSIVSYSQRVMYKGGGTLIAVKKEIQAVKNCSFQNVYVEKCIEFCSVNLQIGESKLTVLCIYRSPSGNLADFFSKLREIVEISPIGDRVILVGDFNTDLKIENNFTLEFLNILRTGHFFPTVFEDTRVTASRIDNLFCNFHDAKYTSGVVENALADHRAIDFKLAVDGGEREKEIQGRFVRLIDEYTTGLMRAKLTDIKNALVFDDADNLIKQIVDSHNFYFPLRFKKFKNKSLGGVSKDCKKQHYSKVSELAATLNRIRKTENFDRAKYLDTKKALCEEKFSYKRRILQAKSTAVKNIIDKSDNPSKALWNIVNDHRASKKSIPFADSIFVNNALISDQEKIVCHFNNHFISVFSNDSNAPINDSNFVHMPQCDSIFYFPPVTQENIIRAIDKLKNKKSEDRNGLSNFFVKTFKRELAPIFTHLVNSFIVDNKLPESLKTVRIVPLFKSGDLKDMNNYRPLAMVSPISKVYEQIMIHQINRYLDINKILYTHQFGF